MKLFFRVKNNLKKHKALIKIKKSVRTVISLIKKGYRNLSRKLYRVRRNTRFGQFIPSRKTALYMSAALILFTAIIDVVNIAPVERTYALDDQTEQLVGTSTGKFSDVLEYNSQDSVFEYNKNYSPSSGAIGTVSGPRFTAQLHNSMDEEGIAVNDPVNNSSIKLKSLDDTELAGRNENRVIYPFKDMNAKRVYTLGQASIKEDIVLDEFISNELSFNYELELSEGLEARIESNGSIGVYGASSILLGNVVTGNDEDQALLDKARNKADKNNLIFTIPAPYIVEYSKEDTETNTWYELEGNKITLRASNLESANYPLTIDPTIYIETAQSLMRGNNETNTDFDVSNELIQKSQTTGARFDEWQSTMNLNAGRWNGGSTVAGGYIYQVGGEQGSESVVSFATPGTSTFIVPTGVTTITARIWGAGGGGGGGGNNASSEGGNGGGGGYAQADLTVTPGESLNVIVGGGGGAGDYSTGDAGTNSGDGGGGGGHSEINRSGTNLIIAGGGGGGGGGDNSGATDGGDGGAGGGDVAEDGDPSGSAGEGDGGDQSGGGNGGTGSNNDGDDGDSEIGGAGADGGDDSPDCGTGDRNNGGTSTGGDGGEGDDCDSGYAGGGGGGSGYYGGGGGAGSVASNAGGGGGGGGSSYVTGASTTETTGSGQTPGNDSDSLRNGAGDGGTGGLTEASGTAGDDGIVVITYTTSGGTGPQETVYWAELNSSTNAIEQPNPGTGACAQWCTDSVYDLPDERAGFSLVAYNGYLYAMGGEDDTGTRQSTVYISKLGANGEPSLWHPTDTDKSNWDYWYSDTGLNGGTAKSYFAAAAYNNRMYVVGGQTNASPGGVTTVEVADILPNGRLANWTTTGMQALPSGAGTHMQGLHIYNDTMYVLGGFEGVETSSANLRSAVYFSNIESNGSINAWQSSPSFTTARANFGGTFSYVWGAYIYIGGGCSAVNGSGYCTTMESDMQLISINADGSLNEWKDLGNQDNARIGYSLIGWQGGIYRIGGCTSIDTGDGSCDATLANIDYGAVNPAGEVSTVDITETSGAGDCTGGSPFNCDLPPVGDDAGEGGQLLAMSVVLNGYLYVIGGCVEYQCDGADEGSGDDNDSSGNVSYASVGSDGDLEAPSSCGGTSYGAWCTDASNRVNGTDGVSAAGVTVFEGRIYIVGGFEDNASGNGDYSPDIYYNSTNADGSLAGTWSSVDLTDIGATDVAYTYTFARANPASAGSVPGNLYILGGCDSLGAPPSCSSYSTEVFKCDIGTSGAVSNCTTTDQLQIDSTPGTGGTNGLGIHSGTVYANYVYLIGGYSDAEADKDDVLYARIDDNNDIVAVTGSDWIESPNKLAVGRRRGWAFGYNGHIYSVGGYDADTSQTIPFIEWAKIDVSDGSIDPFTTSSVQINQRWGLSMAVSNSYAYVVGGCDVGASPGSCESFEPSVQIFQLFNNDSGAVDDFTAQTDQTFSNDTDRWGASAAVKDGYLYVAGGCTSATDCTTVTDDVQYAPIDSADGSIGTWTALEAMPAARAWGYLGLAGGDLYYVGGEDAAGDEKSDVYYITPNPGGSGLGTLEHYSSKRVSQQTKSADGWSAVTGTVDTGTTASTNGWVDSSNLTVGDDYLVMVWGAHNDSNNATQSGMRVTHGGTAFTESQAIEEVDRTNASWKTPYFWFTVWEAQSGEDLEVEYYRNGSGTARVEDVTMIVMNAEELIADGDLQYDVNDTAGGTLSDTFTANSSLSWTPANNNDTWWIMGYVQGDTNTGGGDQLEYRLNVDSTAVSTASIEGENTADTPLYGIGWVEALPNSLQAINLEIRESSDNDHFEWDSSAVMALNLDRFEDFAEYSTAGDGPTMSTVDDPVEQGGIEPSVTTQGDWLIAAGAIADDDNGRIIHHLELGGSPITDEIGGWQASTADKVPASLADVQIDLTTGSKDIDYFSQFTSSSGNFEIEDVWIVAFSMEQGGTNSWATASNGLPGDRTRFGGAVWNDRIYVVGGLDDSANETNTVYVSPQLNNGGDISSAWTTSTSFDTARQGAAVTAYANNLYLFGGYDGTNYLSDTQFTQINTDGTVDAWTFSEQMQNAVRDAVAVSANGYIYLVGGRTATSTCSPRIQVVPISANTTIATGNNPTGVGSWYETNVRYSGDRYGAAVAYEDGRLYTMGGGCSSPLSSNRHYESTINSQPQVAIYSRMIDTDTDVFPNGWLLNGLDNSIGARWEVRYRSMHDLDGIVNPTEDCGSSETMPQMTTWGNDTDFGDVTLGDVNPYTALNDSDEDINCARYFYFFISIDASRTFGYPEDVNRGPTIDDLSLFFTSDPNKRLRHGKTFTGGEQQPLDTPCRQSVDADCPKP